MALRIPTRTADRITVISYLDDAIDFDHVDAEQLVADYIAADTPDHSLLPMVEGRTPTKFVLRPLSEREMAIAEDMARRYDQPEGGEIEIKRNNAEANYQLLRLGLADVTGFDGWAGVKERLYSVDVWTMESVADIDRHTAEFLALTIRRWSQLQKKTNGVYGSLPGGANGTDKTSEERGHTTAKSAKSTKATRRSTAAAKSGPPARAN